jgi:hypothetical protein
VEGARARQATRFAGNPGGRAGASGRAGARPAPTGLTTNADMGPTEVRDHCAVDEAGRQLLGTAMRQMHLSARAPARILGPGCHRILKLARTIADLEGAEPIQPAHIAMSIYHRPRSSTGRAGRSRGRLRSPGMAVHGVALVFRRCLRSSIGMLQSFRGAKSRRNVWTQSSCESIVPAGRL